MNALRLREWAKRAAIGRWSASLLIAAGIQTVALSSLQAATPKKEITDSGITAAVEGGLKLDKGVFPNDVDVSTSHGIVTLSGTVNNLLAKERAVMAAKSIRGVLEVVDKIVVTPVSRSDEDIRKDIQTALKQDPATESYQVAVSVQGAGATLTGSVGSYTEKQLTARIAKGVKGVKVLSNDVTINYLAKRTDAEIAADVKARLQWDTWINGGLINPVAKDGKVTLTGMIGSAISKSRAFDDAWVNGVISVDDSGLKIEPQAHTNAQQKLKSTISSDGEIKQAVQAALRLDARVSAFSPDVTVEDGVVILGGSAGNLRAKTAAAQDAKSVVGVSLVENHLKVRPTGGPADAAAMEKQLKAALLWNPFLDSFRIDVAVIDRVAYLSGTVDSSFQKAEAQDVASRIKGVGVIQNHLKVEPEYYSISDYDYYNDYYYPAYDYGYYDDYGYYGWPYYNQSPYYVSKMFGPQPYLSDEQIKKNIENRFFWSPFVDRDDIKVTVNGGVATLTGRVGTWIGWGEAEKDAHKGGASFVLDNVTVD
jgi:osmotically-inducible protein OsmY